MIALPNTTDAYKLMLDGSKTLSQIEANGICIDTTYLEDAIESSELQIQKITAKMKKKEVFKKQKKKYGSKTKIGSRPQLAKILFDVMGYEAKERTKTDRTKTDEHALMQVPEPYVKMFLKLEKLKKACNTYLKGIRREMTNGFIHPFYNLHLVVTLRSSSDHPNFQNMPIRIPMMNKLIRQCFIPRSPKRRIVELDYSRIEVHGASWYNKDPVLLDYLFDNTKDMHRDMAKQCFRLPMSELVPTDDDDKKRIGAIRFTGKNDFVFPEFYGDYFGNCATALWEDITRLKLKTRNGRSLKRHLRKKGIKNYNDFESHIKKVESHFWNKRFKVYNEWKDSHYEQYLKTCAIELLSGFTISGYFERNKVINFPVQGVAFHCLLWSLIRLERLMRKYNMKSLLIGQIHDSIVADVLKKELRDFLDLAHQVMVVDLKKHWKFIITPIEIEAEASPPGLSWYHKKEIKLS
jgi:DNA polymerase-1